MTISSDKDCTSGDLYDKVLSGITHALEHAIEPDSDFYGKKRVRIPPDPNFDPNVGHKIKIPKYSLAEELMNSISHGVGGLLAIAALVIGIVMSMMHGNVWAVASSAVYGSSLVLLYVMSTLYHSLAINNAKRVFRVIDHCCIYLLIAGTYTPYTLVALRSYNPALAWTLFGIVWGAAAVGITLTAIDVQKFRKAEMITYLASGCVILFAFIPMTHAMAPGGILLLLLGGLMYLIGALLYGVGKKVKYMHSVFHIFVLSGSMLHFFSILLYVL